MILDYVLLDKKCRCFCFVSKKLYICKNVVEKYTKSKMKIIRNRVFEFKMLIYGKL